MDEYKIQPCYKNRYTLLKKKGDKWVMANTTYYNTLKGVQIAYIRYTENVPYWEAKIIYTRRKYEQIQRARRSKTTNM